MQMALMVTISDKQLLIDEDCAVDTLSLLQIVFMSTSSLKDYALLIYFWHI